MKRQRDRLKGVPMDRSLMGGSADKGARGTRVALFLLVLCINLMGDGIRDVTAPENRN